MDKTRRRVEISKGDRWVETSFKDLKDGDVFRLFDGEEIVKDKEGRESWVAYGDPFLNEDGIWTIATLPKEK